MAAELDEARIEVVRLPALLRQPTKKGQRANIAERSPKDHRRNNKLECVNAL